MSHQSTFGNFTESTEKGDDAPDIWSFDDFGPTMDRPTPTVELNNDLGPNAIDKRQLPGTGLTPFDVAHLAGKVGWGRARGNEFHPDDERARDVELEHFQEMMQQIHGAVREELPHPSNIFTEYELEEIPEDVQIDAEKADIEAANRTIRKLIQEIGHHDPARRALQDWAKDQTENFGDWMREKAFAIDVGEFAMGKIDDMGKADVVEQFAKSEHPDCYRQAIEEYNEQLRSKCESQLAEERQQREAREFAENPPEEVQDWERFEAEKPDVELAYRAEVHGTLEILAIKEEDGELEAFGTIWEWWNAAETAAEMKVNRHIVRVDRDNPDPHRDLLSQLKMLSADPFPQDAIDDDQEEEPDAVTDTETLPGGFEYVGMCTDPDLDFESPDPVGPIYVWERDDSKIGVYENDEFADDGYPFTTAKWIDPIDGENSYWKHTHIAESWSDAVESARKNADHRTYIVQSDSTETYPEWQERTGGTSYERSAAEDNPIAFGLEEDDDAPESGSQDGSDDDRDDDQEGSDDWRSAFDVEDDSRPESIGGWERQDDASYLTYEADGLLAKVDRPSGSTFNVVIENTFSSNSHNTESFERYYTDGAEERAKNTLENWLSHHSPDDTLEWLPDSKSDQDEALAQFSSGQRGQIEHYAERGNLGSTIRAIGADTRMNMAKCFNDAGIESPADLVDVHEDDEADFQDVEGVGPKTAEKLEAAIPLVENGLIAARVNDDQDEDDQEESSDDLEADGGEKAVADGGTIEEDDEIPTEPEPGDDVLLIEKVAVGRMSPPSTIEGYVSKSGKSVMIPEDGDSIHGSRRLDAETIFGGDSEYRDSTAYELYTPGRFRSRQRANHAPGPQVGANEISDVEDLPDPTHWPAVEAPEDAPDECPECGQSGGLWHDVGKPRCMRCGETIDPDDDQDDEQDDDTPETPDKWDLSRLSRGDLLILDGYSDEFLVADLNRSRYGNVMSVTAATRDGGEWTNYELKVLDAMEGRRLQVKPEADTRVFVNVNDDDHARDFEKIGRDEDKLRRWVRDSRDW